MLKKLAISFIFILIITATFLAGYLFSRKSDLPDQQALINNSLVERFNQTEEKYVEPTGLFELTSGEASFPTIRANGEIWYYTPKNGEIRSASFKNLLAGSALVAKIQPNAINISWGSDKTLLANYSTGAIYYDLGSNFSKKYEINIKNPVLSKTGNKTAYIYFNQESGEGNISIANPKLESFKNVLPTRFTNWQIKWLGENKLALTKPPTLESSQASLFTLDTENGKTLQNIINLKNNLEVAWSPDEQKIVYSYVDSSTGQNGLYLMNLGAKEEMPLNLNYTASKCVWSFDNKTVYCAGVDSFVSLDATAANAGTQTIANSQSIDASSATNLFLTSTGDYIIFKNIKDGKLYGLHLAQ
ncbi:MAG: hypothetical protein HYT61_00135 [Candidatus Yanofskybacteria bacterium]|nr:hypothetical protein [Candidatus Yanofskybacteria bacterium]